MRDATHGRKLPNPSRSADTLLPAYRKLENIAREIARTEGVTEERGFDLALERTPRLYEAYRAQRRALPTCREVKSERIEPWDLDEQRAKRLNSLDAESWRAESRFTTLVERLRQHLPKAPMPVQRQELPKEPKVRRSALARVHAQLKRQQPKRIRADLQWQQSTVEGLTVAIVLEVIEALEEAERMAAERPRLVEVKQLYDAAMATWKGRERKTTKKKSTNERARQTVNVLLGRKKRLKKRPPSYDAVRVVQAYRDLTTEVIRRPTFDANGGIDWNAKTWRQCGLTPPPGSKLKRNDRLRLPIPRKDAIKVIARELQATYRGVYDQLKRAGVRGLPSTWPKV